MRTIVHLSDLHFGRLDERIIPPLLDQIDRLAPDLVAISGDLTQRARRQQFEHARAFLNRIPYPRLVVPGNHDVPLFNLAARLLDPFGGYRRHIGPDLEPAHIDREMAVVGLNSARSLTTGGRGRLNMTQVIAAADRLRRIGASLYQGHRDASSVRRAGRRRRRTSSWDARPWRLRVWSKRAPICFLPDICT